MKLVLIGFMGSGKSTVSTLLSQALSCPLMDTDALALELSKKESIPDIFQTEGESAFRMLELTVAQSLRTIEHAVIATGGGMVMNQLAMDALCQNAQVIYLKTSLEHVLERIGNDDNRPLLQNKLKLAKLYEMRCALYEHYANWTVETDNRSPEDISQLIDNEFLYSNVKYSSSLLQKQESPQV